MTMDLWHYHDKPAQLIGSDRVQLRNLMGYYSGTVDHDDFPEDVKKPKFQDKYLRQVLAKATTEDEIGMAVFYASQMSGERIPEIEPLLLKSRDRGAAIKYAKDVLNSSWPELEQLLLDNNEVDSLLHYMDKLEKHTWPALAKRILALPDSTIDELKTKNRYLISYAIKTQQRWPAAEPSILKQGFFTLRYIIYVIRAPWPEAEPVLVKSGYVQTYLAYYPRRRAACEKLGYKSGD